MDRMRPLGLAPLTCLELSPPEFIDCAACAGLDFVGLRLIPATPADPRYPMTLAGPLARATLERLKETGLRVMDVEIFRLTPQVDVRAFESVLELAQSFGASQALVAGQDDDWARLADRLSAFAELAGRFGIQANLEPMPWVAVDRLEAALEVIRRTGMQDVGVIIDALHFDRAGTRLDVLASVPSSRLNYMQLCDAPAQRPLDHETMIRQARGERLMPGDGGLDLGGLLRTLPRVLPVSLEIPMAELARTVPARERVARMVVKTRRLLSEVEAAR